MKTFAQNLAALMPDWVNLPTELVETFDWLEDQGSHHVREGGAPEDHWLSIYPAQYLSHPGASHVTFGGSTLPFTGHWSAPDAKIDNRIAEIATTSGDGGRAAIWLDQSGKQQFVHIGYDTLGIITDDPLVFVQFMAMGYPEPGALEGTDLTPLQSALDYNGHETLDNFAPEDLPVPPVAFQIFLHDRFGLTMPATARDIGIGDFTEYGDTESTDAFARWVTSVTPEPTEADLAYEMELMRTVDSLDLKDSDSSDEILQKIGTLFKSKE